MSKQCLLRLKDLNSKKTRMRLAVHVDVIIVTGSKTTTMIGCVLCCRTLCFQRMSLVSLRGGIRDNRLTGCTVQKGRFSIRQYRPHLIARCSSISTISRRPSLPPLRSTGQENKERARDKGTAHTEREAVGSLMWVSLMSRADFETAIREVAPNFHNPDRSHWDAVRGILKNLRHRKLKRNT